MTILRVGCYERVSTDEQALRGFSIDAQIDNLTEYCEKNNLRLVGHYTDAGISGSLSPLKRPALQRLLEDVQAGKIDMILFTKLDRWFRSVKEYFKVQEILDRHKVEWKTIHEDYDTSTANGRMAITIFLAIAQNERERTSERVRTVLKHKRKNKEACFGGPNVPFGYMKQNDADGNARLVKNPAEEKMCQDFWQILIDHGNLAMAMRHMYNTYGIRKCYTTWAAIKKSPFYYGMYDGVEGFCEPYVSKADWDKVQATFDAKKYDSTAKRQYFFRGMMRCPTCGSCLTTSYSTAMIGKKKTGKQKKEYYLYRCRHEKAFCTYNRTMTEMRLERDLLRELPKLIKREIEAIEAEEAARNLKPNYNIKALKEKLRTINESYMAGNKTDEEYINECNEIKDLIETAKQEKPQVKRDLTLLKKFLDDDFADTYKKMDRKGKHSFWQSMIKEIVLDDNQIANVIFKY